MLCLSKGENCPSLNLVQAVFSLHLHSATWSVLSTVILLHFTQVLRNYTGKCNHQLSETLMAAYLWHCSFPQDVSDCLQNLDSIIHCLHMKIPEITFDLSVRKRTAPTENVKNTNYFKGSFPSFPALFCSWHLLGGSDILKVLFTVVWKSNKYSPSPWLKSLHGITYLDYYNKFQWWLLLLVLLFLIFSLYKHNFPSACK